MTDTLLKPLLFGEPGSELFGLYESGARGGRDCAVLICQPLGQEYVRCHRPLRLLARRLCEAGFPVLRFDYFGCGDSAGSSRELDLARLVSDVGRAARRLREESGAAKLCLVGLRFGATLALLASRGLVEVDLVALWEPVVDGDGHMAQLERQDAELRAKLGAGAAVTEPGIRELLGFAYREAFLAEAGRVQLGDVEACSADRVLLMRHTAQGVPQAPNPLVRLGERVELGAATCSRFWLDEPFEVVMPDAAIKALSSWVARWG